MMTLSTKGDPSAESVKEKSGYEKFEAELKETIFAVIFLLIEEAEESLWYSIVDAVIELFQLLNFPYISVLILSYYL